MSLLKPDLDCGWGGEFEMSGEGAGGKSVPTTSDGVRKGLTPVPPSWGRFIVPVPLYTDSF